jgi:hypothetical protein
VAAALAAAEISVSWARQICEWTDGFPADVRGEANVILLAAARGGACSFHHLIVIHRWGWSIALNPNGTTTLTSPGGGRILHSHGPPPAA